MSTPITEVAQLPSPGAIVELFEIDFSPIDSGAPTLYLTSNVNGNDPLIRDSVVYIPAPIEGNGFDLGGDGKMPRPTLSVSNATFLLNPYVWAGGDLIGAKVTRIVTLYRYLDGQPDEDDTAVLRTDVYTIEQKTQSNRMVMEFQLVAEFDQSGVKLPKRQAFSDVCLLRYRTWNGSGWDAGTCPYDGTTSYWDISDTSTTEANDRCSKTYKGCKLREANFTDERLPAEIFPGLLARG